MNVSGILTWPGVFTTPILYPTLRDEPRVVTIPANTRNFVHPGSFTTF